MDNVKLSLKTLIFLFVCSFLTIQISAQYTCGSAVEIQFPIISTTQYIQAPGPVGSNESNWFFIEVDQTSYLNIISIDESQNARLSVYKGSCVDPSLIAHSAESCAIGSSVTGFSVEMGDIVYLDWQVDCSTDAFLFTVDANLECDDDIEVSGSFFSNNTINGIVIMSDAQIADQTETVLQASSEIALHSGFEVELGAMFNALIAACSN